MSDPYLSVVVPVYNEEANLPELLDRLIATLVPLGRPMRSCWSTTAAATAPCRCCARPRRSIRTWSSSNFNRNYGQHAAVFAGFEVSRGEVVVTLDADLQNPPEEIPRLVAKMEEGFDVVGSIRVHRQDTLLRRAASRIVNRMTAVATGAQLTDYGCMLRAYRRQVAKHLAASNEASTFIPVLADLFAGRVTEIPVAHAERRHGESKYSTWKLFRLQFDLMTSFSVLRLRVTMGVGVAMAIIAFLVALVLIAGRLIYGHEWAVSGIFTLFSLVFFFLGGQLFAIGLLGEYVGRIYQQVRDRPRYLIRQVIRGETNS